MKPDSIAGRLSWEIALKELQILGEEELRIVQFLQFVYQVCLGIPLVVQRILVSGKHNKEIDKTLLKLFVNSTSGL